MDVVWGYNLMLGLIVPVLAGSRGRLVPLGNITITDTRTSTANADVRIRYQSDGRIWRHSGIPASTFILIGQWYFPQPRPGVGAAYEVRNLTETSGFWQVGASPDNVWIDLSVNREWQKIRTEDVGGTNEVICTMEIREIANTSNVQSHVVTARAVVVE